MFLPRFFGMAQDIGCVRWSHFAFLQNGLGYGIKIVRGLPCRLPCKHHMLRTIVLHTGDEYVQV